MSVQRLSGLLLIAAQAGLMAYLTGAVAFPASVVALALLGFVSTTRVAISREAGFRAAAGLAIAFIIKYRLAPPELAYDALFIRTQLAHVIAQYVLVMQVVQFFLERENDRLPLSLPAWAAVGMVLASDVQIRNDQRAICQSLALLYIVATGIFFAASRRPARGQFIMPRHRAHRVALTVFLTAVCTTAWFTSTVLFRNERRIEIFIVELLAGQRTAHSVGFAGTARLGDLTAWKRDRENHVALRVYSESAPGYLRGRAFERYRMSEWQAENDASLINAQPHPPAPYDRRASGEQIFRWGSSYPNDAVSYQCWRSESVDGMLFTPLHTTVIKADANEIWVSSHGLFRATGLPANYPYQAFASRQPNAAQAFLSDQQREVLTYVSRRRFEESPEIQALAARVFADCRTTREKIEAVVRHFHQNYTYKLGVEPGVYDDPLRWFLLEGTEGHCEYFASGAAILLRLAGVPCRYVTGFVVDEKNRYGGYWVARNRDAHAWVEAFDDERGWVLVEATPGDGIPSTDSEDAASAFSQFLDSVRDRLQRLKVDVERGGLGWVAERLIVLLGSGPGLSLTCGLLGVVLWHFRRHLRRPARPSHDASLRDWHRVLSRMDRRLKRAGFQRETNETLNQFADRLAQSPAEEFAHRASHWYRRYAELRYRTLTPAASSPPELPAE